MLARSTVQTGFVDTELMLFAVTTFCAGCSSGMKGPVSFCCFC